MAESHELNFKGELSFPPEVQRQIDKLAQSLKRADRNTASQIGPYTRYLVGRANTNPTGQVLYGADRYNAAQLQRGAHFQNLDSDLWIPRGWAKANPSAGAGIRNAAVAASESLRETQQRAQAQQGQHELTRHQAQAAARANAGIVRGADTSSNPQSGVGAAAMGTGPKAGDAADAPAGGGGGRSRGGGGRGRRPPTATAGSPDEGPVFGPEPAPDAGEAADSGPSAAIPTQKRRIGRKRASAGIGGARTAAYAADAATLTPADRDEQVRQRAIEAQELFEARVRVAKAEPERRPYIPGMSGSTLGPKPDSVEGIIQRAAAGQTREKNLREAHARNPELSRWLPPLPADDPGSGGGKGRHILTARRGLRFGLGTIGMPLTVAAAGGLMYSEVETQTGLARTARLGAQAGQGPGAFTQAVYQATQGLGMLHEESARLAETQATLVGRFTNVQQQVGTTAGIARFMGISAQQFLGEQAPFYQAGALGGRPGVQGMSDQQFTFMIGNVIARSGLGARSGELIETIGGLTQAIATRGAFGAAGPGATPFIAGLSTAVFGQSVNQQEAQNILGKLDQIISSPQTPLQQVVSSSAAVSVLQSQGKNVNPFTVAQLQEQGIANPDMLKGVLGTGNPLMLMGLGFKASEAQALINATKPFRTGPNGTLDTKALANYIGTGQAGNLKINPTVLTAAAPFMGANTDQATMHSALQNIINSGASGGQADQLRQIAGHANITDQDRQKVVDLIKEMGPEGLTGQMQGTDDALKSLRNSVQEIVVAAAPLVKIFANIVSGPLGVLGGIANSGTGPGNAVSNAGGGSIPLVSGVLSKIGGGIQNGPPIAMAATALAIWKRQAILRAVAPLANKQGFGWLLPKALRAGEAVASEAAGKIPDFMGSAGSEGGVDIGPLLDPKSPLYIPQRDSRGNVIPPPAPGQSLWDKLMRKMGIQKGSGITKLSDKIPFSQSTLANSGAGGYSANNAIQQMNEIRINTLTIQRLQVGQVSSLAGSPTNVATLLSGFGAGAGGIPGAGAASIGPTARNPVGGGGIGGFFSGLGSAVHGAIGAIGGALGGGGGSSNGAFGGAPQSTLGTSDSAYQGLAEEWSKKTGLPASMYMAIMGNESAGAARSANALFGVQGKGFPYTDYNPKTGKYYNAELQTYPTPNDSFAGVSSLITGQSGNEGYKAAYAQFQKDHDATAFLKAINEAGYAQDPNWWKTISNVMNGSSTFDPNWQGPGVVPNASDSTSLNPQGTDAAVALGGYMTTQSAGQRRSIAFDPAVVVLKDARGNVINTVQLQPRWKDEPMGPISGF